MASIETDPSAKLRGLIIGTAVGDSLGLPYEGRGPRFAGKPGAGGGTIAITAETALSTTLWQQSMVLGNGLISDDTEHMLLVIEALADMPASGSVDDFQRYLATRLRWWFLALPPGIGMATLKACVRLWLSFSPKRSGVFSAGNGAAMRSAIIGALRWEAGAVRRSALVRASSIVTHTDPRALIGAEAVAEVAAWEMRRGIAAADEEGVTLPSSAELQTLMLGLPSAGAVKDWSMIVEHMRTAAEARETVGTFCARLEADTTLEVKLNTAKGVSGFTLHTVPVAIYAWLRHYGEFPEALAAVLECGGDTDTVAAITGALAGCTCGDIHIPDDWQKKIITRPFSLDRSCVIAEALLAGDSVTGPTFAAAKRQAVILAMGETPEACAAAATAAVVPTAEELAAASRPPSAILRYPVHLLRNLATIPLIFIHLLLVLFRMR